MQLCAVSGLVGDPPQELERTLLQRARRLEFEYEMSSATDLTRAGEEQEDEADQTQFIMSAPPPANDGAFHTELLNLKREGKFEIVGAVILQAAPGGSLRIDHGYLTRVASALRARAGE
jgi:hypothetical protein